MEWIFDQTARRAREETRAVFSARGESPAIKLSRLADLTRSNWFLWVEAGLQAQERFSRGSFKDSTVPRTLLLATVAADIASGYLSLRERVRWCPGLVRPDDWELQHQRGAHRLLDSATSLGGALIKAGQFASTRPDILPLPYIRALSRLQDSIPAHPWPVMQALIAQELGRQPQEMFSWIEQHPIAAASIAQVHRAQLRDGRKVAVKIQYPEVAALVRSDLGTLDFVFSAVARVSRSIQLSPILDYLKYTLPIELDFQHEARAISDIRSALRHREDVVIPAVVPELSTRRLLTMEFVEGIKITDRAALLRAGISPQRVARQLNDLYAEQMLQLGILHADPHPGNLLVQPGPLLVLLDHGLTVSLPSSLVQSLRRMVRSLVAGDFDELTKALREAGVQIDEHTDITTLFQLVGVLLGGGTADAAGGTGDISLRLGRSIGGVPTDFILVGRALGLLDGITKQLEPDLDVLQVIAKYAQAD